MDHWTVFPLSLHVSICWLNPKKQKKRLLLEVSIKVQGLSHTFINQMSHSKKKKKKKLNFPENIPNKKLYQHFYLEDYRDFKY